MWFYYTYYRDQNYFWLNSHFFDLTTHVHTYTLYLTKVIFTWFTILELYSLQSCGLKWISEWQERRDAMKDLKFFFSFYSRWVIHFLFNPPIIYTLHSCCSHLFNIIYKSSLLSCSGLNWSELYIINFLDEWSQHISLFFF